MSKRNNSFRVFVDSNVLISAIRSKQSISSKLLYLVLEEHHLIICTYTLAEVSKVINKRFPNMIAAWDHMLSSLEFELAYTPSDVSTYKAPYIRDEKDIPILISAIIAHPDVLVTGDLDFHTSEIQEHFAVYTPSNFLKNFGHQLLDFTFKNRTCIKLIPTTFLVPLNT